MITCNSCGAENPEGAAFCNRCAAVLSTGSTAQSNAPQSTQPKSLEKQMDELGKSVGKAGEEIGRRYSDWYNKRFGLMGPLVDGILRQVIFTLAVVVIALILSDSDFWADIRDFAIIYFPLLGILSVWDRYAELLRRKRNKRYWRFSPAIWGLAAVAWIWVLIQVSLIAGDDLGWDNLYSFASDVEDALPVIGVLIVVIGLLVTLQRLFSPGLIRPWPHP